MQGSAMQKMSPAVERAVRIELLRARAAIERESLAHGVAETGRALSPSHLIKGLLPGFSGGGSTRLVWQAIGLVRRYPVILSSVSAMVLGGNKRSKLLKLATGAVVGWQVFRAWQSRQGDDGGPPSHTPPSVP
jgi:hypothetical protein